MWKKYGVKKELILKGKESSMGKTFDNKGLGGGIKLDTYLVKASKMIY